MAWLFHDEATPKTAALLNRLATETAPVPTWWFIEITNVLAMAERKGRINPMQSDAFIVDLSKLGIEESRYAARAWWNGLWVFRLDPFDQNHLNRSLGMDNTIVQLFISLWYRLSR